MSGDTGEGSCSRGAWAGPGRSGGRSLSVLPGDRVPELSVPPPRVSPPARARWGARGAALAARPHCDVAGPRQRLRRPPGLLRPPLSPSVGPSLPPVLPRSGESRSPAGAAGRRGTQAAEAEPVQLCTGRHPERSRDPRGPLCASGPFCPGPRGAAAESHKKDRCGNPGSFTPGDPSHSRLAVQGSGSGDCSFHWPLRWHYCLLLPWMVPEAGMGCAEAPRSSQGGAKAW